MFFPGKLILQVSEFPVLHIIESLVDLGSCVHYKRSVGGNWFHDWFAAEDQDDGIFLCFYCELFTIIGEQDEIICGAFTEPLTSTRPSMIRAAVL